MTKKILDAYVRLAEQIASIHYVCAVGEWEYGDLPSADSELDLLERQLADAQAAVSNILNAADQNEVMAYAEEAEDLIEEAMSYADDITKIQKEAGKVYENILERLDEIVGEIREMAQSIARDPLLKKHLYEESDVHVIVGLLVASSPEEWLNAIRTLTKSRPSVALALLVHRNRPSSIDIPREDWRNVYEKLLAENPVALGDYVFSFLTASRLRYWGENEEDWNRLLDRMIEADPVQAYNHLRYGRINERYKNIDEIAVRIFRSLAPTCPELACKMLLSGNVSPEKACRGIEWVLLFRYVMGLGYDKLRDFLRNYPVPEDAMLEPSDLARLLSDGNLTDEDREYIITRMVPHVRSTEKRERRSAIKR